MTPLRIEVDPATRLELQDMERNNVQDTIAAFGLIRDGLRALEAVDKRATKEIEQHPIPFPESGDIDDMDTWLVQKSELSIGIKELLNKFPGIVEDAYLAKYNQDVL